MLLVLSRDTDTVGEFIGRLVLETFESGLTNHIERFNNTVRA